MFLPQLCATFLTASLTLIFNAETFEIFVQPFKNFSVARKLLHGYANSVSWFPWNSRYVKHTLPSRFDWLHQDRILVSAIAGSIRYHHSSWTTDSCISNWLFTIVFDPIISDIVTRPIFLQQQSGTLNREDRNRWVTAIRWQKVCICFRFVPAVRNGAVLNN